MNSTTRRWWLLAIAGAPVLLGITAQALSVRLDGDYLRISAPNLTFLTKPLVERLKDGRAVDFLAQLTVATGAEKTVQGRSIARFTFSYDIWLERYKVTLLGPGPTAAKSNLTLEGAEAWCLDQLKVDLRHIPSGRPIFIRLEMKSEDSKKTDGIVGEPGISLSGLIELLGRPAKNEQVHLVEEIGPVSIAEIRKSRS